MYEELKQSLAGAQNIVFFTGAGISTDSGIPDFRSANGLYNTDLRSEEIISHSYFLSHPREFYDFYRHKMIYPEAGPNYAHEFIAKLASTKNVTVVTQNIDGLHQMAGSHRVIELHGSIHHNYCMKCHKRFDLKKIIDTNGIPYCDCGGIVKPDVILYEEPLNDKVISEAIRAISTADMMIICGTSLNVYPAASFVRFFQGKSLCLINRDETQADSFCDIVIHDSLSKVLLSVSE